MGVYLAMDEKFGFFFADIAGPSSELASNVNPGVEARNPFSWATAPGNEGQSQAQPSSEATAVFVSGIDNDIVGPEIGLNAKLPFLYFFELDLLGQFSFALNWLENERALIRGDGLELYNYRKVVQSTSGIFEGHLGLTARILPNVTIRGGWEWLYLMSIGTAIGNIGVDEVGIIDLNRRPRASNNENILWSGWYAGCEMLF